MVTTARVSTEETCTNIVDICLTDLLCEQALSDPGRVAVVFGEARLTYGELADASAGIGAHLRDLGVGGDSCVGLFVEPSVDLMVGVWGILFAGGAYLPLAPEYPEDRLRYMVEHSRARVILCGEGLKQRVTELALPGTVVISVAEAAKRGRSSLAREDLARPDPSHLAYVIYTSGSTGRPKGVMIEHRSIVNQMRWLEAAYGLGPSTVVLQKTPMSFDAAQWEILANSCGAQVVVGSPGVHRDPERMLQIVAEHRVTALQCVPTLLQALLDTGRLARASSLTQIFSGGEALSKSLARRCLRTLPSCQLVNLYGPTECTINASACTVDGARLDADSASVPIGMPVHGTAFHILTSSGRPAAAGEVGELYISGVQVARGYLHDPELTAERFLASPFASDDRRPRLYKTGDLAHWNADGSAQFVCRTDNQIKLRGHRIELDEIRLAIADHDWIRNAAVIVKDDPATGFQNLIAFIELDSEEAALMDQGNHGSHHQSKASRLQLKAQLSGEGCLSAAEMAGLEVIDLPGSTPTPEQRRRVYARKTYRFFEGGEVGRTDILRLLERRVPDGRARSLKSLHLTELGEILRYFGQYHSPERLLPKYGYASPGALYATQMYLEVAHVAGLAAGYYYYHPVHHQLVRTLEGPETDLPRLRIHFVGKTAAIKPVYQTNVQEVLAIEAGHMAGLFDQVLPGYGMAIEAAGASAAAGPPHQWAGGDLHLAAFDVLPHGPSAVPDELEVYVQAHPGRVADLPAGQYAYEAGELVPLSEERILRKHVIAINQRVYDRASFGITLVATGSESWMSYVALGRRLQALMMNEENLGFMSSGYSSRTGRPLPAARRLNAILTRSGRDTGPSYFFLGGRVSDEQRRSEGMKEDSVHMQGPAEMLKEELATLLPPYMVPNRVVVLDKLPLTPNGKVDTAALSASAEAGAEFANRRVVAPRTAVESGISALWRAVTRHDTVSVQDNFFEIGGNSLMAVALVNKINRTFGSSLPLQVLFEHPTVEQLAALVADSERSRDCSRLVRLRGGSRRPIICWPGLGGYPMNLRLLAERAEFERPVYGMQAHGINPGERPYRTIKEMAAGDVKAIRCLQPEGPYSLWGYSFGARVAFETAHQLEQAGEQVDHLFLIAPGSPKVRARDKLAYRSDATYLTILFSVFAGSITDPALDECLSVARDEESLAAFVARRYPNLDVELVRRIVEIVRLTYGFKYEFRELNERQIKAPITIFKARGDDYSFIEGSRAYFAAAPTVIQLDADHYGLLKETGVGELVKKIRYRLLMDRVPELETASGRAS